MATAAECRTRIETVTTEAQRAYLYAALDPDHGFSWREAFPGVLLIEQRGERFLIDQHGSIAEIAD